ncbi:hypothetical protein AJ79_03624 [Helicocarpus griseus UAMH5409]|uniref:Reticulon-like protein n=1 Tax=Helicocarpus griseus UAMH5409 TaxID=1447875 RepID=A0A2B7XNZ7_9EURO|nr:hypothetical protein AJ79_03624 [Helicocarpus griseus UAMH5409]
MYSLLSWERPRATAVSFATIVSLIIAARYLPLLRWAFKLVYISLGFTVALEIAGKVLLSRGLASSSRPRKYYTIPKDTVESILEDLEQLMDFFLIEVQRILFVENLTYTLAAFTAALTSYWLVRFLPLWGLSLVLVSAAYLGPLVYINNRELIDTQIAHLQEVVNSQASQVKEMAGQQTAHATDIVKQYMGEYSAKAHEYIGSPRTFSAVEQVSSPPAAPSRPETITQPIAEPAAEPVASAEPVLKNMDFPTAPQDEPLVETTPELKEEKLTEKLQEPLLA